MFERAVAHLSAPAGHSKPPCSVLSTCALNQHSNASGSELQWQRALAHASVLAAVRVRVRVRVKVTVCSNHRGVERCELTNVLCTALRVHHRASRSRIRMVLYVKGGDPGLGARARVESTITGLMASKPEVWSSASDLRHRADELPWRPHGRGQPALRFPYEHEQRAAAPPRQALCTGWHQGPRALSPRLGHRDPRRAFASGTNDGYVRAWDRCKKDRKDSFYNLPPPNSLNRRGVAILSNNTRFY